MCTAISFKTDDFYFGRNLDLYYHYDESVTVTPRNYVFNLRNGKEIFSHFAIIGIATVSDGYPLYYDAVNERGLCMAGLNFPKEAVYMPYDSAKTNIAPFEFIPYILSRCKNIDDAVTELEKISLWDTPFSDKLVNTPLHWILCDKEGAVTIEQTTDGLRVYDNHVGVLTNSPPFDYHIYNLANYINLSAKYPQNRFSESMELFPYSLGMGALGLPGDMSSASRFVRAAFIKHNSVCDNEEMSSINQTFHILKSVEQPSGITYTKEGMCEYTLYTSVCNASRGIYYYTTYQNSTVCAVSLHNENLDFDKLVSYALITKPSIFFHN